MGGWGANLQLHTEYTPLPPEASTSAASEVQQTQAKLNGTVNPKELILTTPPVRQGHRIRLLLAATANIHGVPLLTHNIHDFRIISDLTDVCDPSALQPVKPEPATESVSDDEQEEPPAT
jgi:hypothetical protein